MQIEWNFTAKLITCLACTLVPGLFVWAVNRNRRRGPDLLVSARYYSPMSGKEKAIYWSLVIAFLIFIGSQISSGFA